MSKRKEIDPEVRIRLIEECLAGRMRGREAARRAGVSSTAMRKWINLYNSPFFLFTYAFLSVTPYRRCCADQGPRGLGSSVSRPALLLLSMGDKLGSPPEWGQRGYLSRSPNPASRAKPKRQGRSSMRYVGRTSGPQLLLPRPRWA